MHFPFCSSYSMKCDPSIYLKSDNKCDNKCDMF